MENYSTCPNCNEPIKSGWNSNKIIAEKDSNFLNYMLVKSSPGYCEKCYSGLITNAESLYKKEKESILDFIKKNIEKVKILTTHSPFGWQYDPISIVTGQSVTGTGFISEFKSSFTDLFGAQSGSFNKKLSDGEKLCFTQLRSKALNLNANAIIATDIDYGEVGDIKGMLMVCAAGTAIRINNLDVLGVDSDIINEMIELNKKLTEMNHLFFRHTQLV